MKTKFIYVCGPHSSGKTTLCRELSAVFGYPKVGEAARQILDEEKMDIRGCGESMVLADHFQKLTAERTLQQHSDARAKVQSGEWPGVIMDRGPDFLVYGTRFSSLGGSQSGILNPSLYRGDEVKVFLLAPDPNRLLEDGVRASVNMETLREIHFGLRCLLTWNSIPFYNLPPTDLLTRVEQVVQICA